LDIKDLYVNIPITENIDIARTQLLEYNHPENTTQICRHLEIILQQNYYIFREQIYQHNKGIAMGSHLSGTMAEIFWQHLENKHIRPLMDSRTNTVLHPLHRWYPRHIWYWKHNQDNLTQSNNKTHTDLQFNPTQESIGYINFLDLKITRKNSHLEIDHSQPDQTFTRPEHFRPTINGNFFNWRITYAT